MPRMQERLADVSIPWFLRYAGVRRYPVLPGVRSLDSIPLY
jgi:hypothetical protein